MRGVLGRAGFAREVALDVAQFVCMHLIFSSIYKCENSLDTLYLMPDL